MPFGESVPFLAAPNKTIEKLTGSKTFVFLIIGPKIQELVVGNSEGIFQTRTMRRDCQDARWSFDATNTLIVSVGERLGGVAANGSLTAPANAFPAEAAMPRGGGFQPRRTYFKPKTFAK